MTEQADPHPADASSASRQAFRPRQIIAMVLLAVCLLWPVWSLTQFHTYLMKAQPSPADARQGWRQLERRMEPVRQFLSPGTVVEYSPTTQIPVAPSRPIDVQFVLSPVIVWRQGQPAQPDLIVADKFNDAELKQYITEHALEPVTVFGGGLAILTRSTSPQEPRP